MLQGEHSAILSTCIKLPSVFKTFVLSIFEWLLKTGFTVNAFSTAKQVCFEPYLVTNLKSCDVEVFKVLHFSPIFILLNCSIPVAVISMYFQSE